METGGRGLLGPVAELKPRLAGVKMDSPGAPIRKGSMPRLLGLAGLAALAVGCGGAHHLPGTSAPRTRRVAAVPGTQAAARGGRTARLSPSPRPLALVTDERQNLVAVVDLDTRTARQFIGIPGAPQYVAARPGVALVTSPGTGSATLLVGRPLRVVAVLHGFASPHVVEIAPGGRLAYVTDDARGTLSAIDLVRRRVIGTVAVGAQAHHMGVSPDGRRVWVALGEAARTIVTVDASDPAHPRVTGRFDPGFAAHDVAFSPDGRQVWISAGDGPDVTVFDGRDRRVLGRIPVGPAPQHIAFAGAVAYLTSGYGSTIEEVMTGSGRMIRRARTPYGSFELAAADGYVTTASLLDGRVAIFTPDLKLVHVIAIGPATRDVEISTQ